MVTFETVQALACALPEVAESTWFRTPAFKVRGRSFLRLREEGDVLVVRVEPGRQEMLIETQPNVYFITSHYRGTPYVLVRMATVEEAELRDLIIDAWRLTAPKRLVAAIFGQAAP
jgi:hypothetical protein